VVTSQGSDFHHSLLPVFIRSTRGLQCLPTYTSSSHVSTMSGKRSRAQYEADLQAQQSPFVVFGTPLPPRDPDVRDDGSYVPVWKQEVRDERGLKRLHGAFTGGFSAG
jgi:hypothetical protein